MHLDLIPRTALLPVLAAQGAWCRMRAPVLPEAAGARRGEVGSGPKIRLLVIGDSSAAGVGVERQEDALLGQILRRLTPHARVRYTLRARTGARTGDILEWLDDLPDPRYDIVVTGFGVNDLTKLVPMQRWLDQQVEMISRFHEEYGTKCFVISGMPPVHQFPLLPQPLRWTLGLQARRFERYQRKVLEEHPDCLSVKVHTQLGRHNMSIDGYHPGPSVYAEWAEAVCEKIISCGLLDRDGSSA